MKKRSLAIIALAVMGLSLTACGYRLPIVRTVDEFGDFASLLRS